MEHHTPHSAGADEGTRHVDLLHRMLEIPSLSGQERPLAEFLRDEMARRGMVAHIDEAGNAVGEIGDHGPLIVLLGHMDTVGGIVPVRQEGALLYGRGAVDAKGPLATFVAAASALATRTDLDRRVVVIGAVEEEAATSRGARHAMRCYQPDAVVIGEPSGWQHLTIGYKGRLLVRYVLRMEMQHTAGAGVSVCEEAVSFWNRVAAWCAGLNVGKGPFDSLTPSLRALASSSDGLHDQVEATLGFRLPPGIEPQQVREWVLEHRDQAEVTFSGAERAVRAGKNNALVRAFLAAVRAQNGTPTFKVKTGTSDMNVVATRPDAVETDMDSAPASGTWNCPILAYGPGDSSLEYMPHEHIDVEEYARAIAVLTAVLQTL